MRAGVSSQDIDSYFYWRRFAAAAVLSETMAAGADWLSRLGWLVLLVGLAFGYLAFVRSLATLNVEKRAKKR